MLKVGGKWSVKGGGPAEGCSAVVVGSDGDCWCGGGPAESCSAVVGRDCGYLCRRSGPAVKAPGDGRSGSAVNRSER